MLDDVFATSDVDNMIVNYELLTPNDHLYLRYNVIHVI